MTTNQLGAMLLAIGSGVINKPFACSSTNSRFALDDKAPDEELGAMGLL